jgi:hypothetical protein
MHNSSRVGPAIVSREEQQAFIPISIRRDRWSRSDPNRFGPPDRQRSWLLQITGPFRCPRFGRILGAPSDPAGGTGPVLDRAPSHCSVL